MNARKLNRYIGEIIIFSVNQKTRGFIKFYSKLICELIYKFLNNEFKSKMFPLKNSENQRMSIHYCYDLTDIKNSLWYGIVLRNLPKNMDNIQITEYCKKISPAVIYALTTKEIFEQICSILVLNDRDEAERLCYFLNNKELNFGTFLKVG